MIPNVIKRALIDVANNRFLHVVCIITIALSVFIVSAFGLFFINATQLLDAWKQGIRVIVYLEDGLTEPQQKQLIDTISSFDGVVDVEFISKDAALKDLKNKIGRQSSILEGLDKNPLPDAIEIRLVETYREIGDVDKMAAKVKALPHVNDVEYAQKWLHRFYGVYNLFKVTGLVLVGMFFIATLLIVANTIRLIMFARREEIEIMRIVGADENFIKYPLYIEALLQGLAGGVFGLGFLYVAYAFTIPEFSPTTLFSFFDIRFIPVRIIAGIIASSMLFGWMGCYFSIRRFLKI